MVARHSGTNFIKSFGSRYRETAKPRRAVRVWKTLGSGDADAGLVLAFDLSQLITQARSFGAIFFSRDLSGQSRCGFTQLSAQAARHSYAMPPLLRS
jgi:hypothetical protein